MALEMSGSLLEILKERLEVQGHSEVSRVVPRPGSAEEEQNF